MLGSTSSYAGLAMLLFGGSGGYAPANAYSYFSFMQSLLSLAIKDVITQEPILNQSGSPKNVVQTNDTVQTFEAGESAFIVGSALVCEDAATNLCTNYNFKPTDFTGVTQTGAAVFSISSAYTSLLSGFNASNGDCYLIDNSLEAAVSSLTFSGGAASTDSHSMQAHIYVISGSAVIRRSTTATGEVTILNNSTFALSELSGFTATIGDKVMIEVAAGATVAVIANQLTVGSTNSSAIEVSGTAVTRLQDSNTSSTYTNLVRSAFWETPENSTVPCRFGDYTDGTGWFNGIHLGLQRGIFLESSGDAGKYPTKVKSNWTGAIATATTGSQILLITRDSIRCDLTVIKGILSDFEHPNEFSIDWSRSAYTEAGVIALRTTSGDINTWDAVEKLPSDNFNLRIKFRLRNDPPTTSVQGFYLVGEDVLSEGVLLGIHPNGDILFFTANIASGAVVIGTNPVIPLVAGGEYVVDCKFVSPNLTITLGDGSTDTIGGFTGTIDFSGEVKHGCDIPSLSVDYCDCEIIEEIWTPV